MKTRMLLSVSFAVLTGLGCGQGYTPSAEEHIAGPQGGGDVFAANEDSTGYKTISFEVLRYELTSVLGLGEGIHNYGTTATTCAGNPTCPLNNPVGYLDTNKVALGAPIYNTQDPNGTLPPGPIQSGGFKVWIQAASSACGIMMQSPNPKLFPSNLASGSVSRDDYNSMLVTLIGRQATDDEAAILDELQGSFADPAHKGAAVCTVALTSLDQILAN